MSAPSPVAAFVGLVESDDFVKATLSKPKRSAAESAENIYLRPILLQGERKISWTHRFSHRDVVENLSGEESSARLSALLGAEFLRADVYCGEREATLFFNRHGEASLRTRKIQCAAPAAQDHDRTKHRLLDANAPWLQLLGLTDARGRVFPQAQDKWRQINKYAEIIDHLASALPANARVADMGCGKGYLTFALYDVLTAKRGLAPQIVGVELRPALVEEANKHAHTCGFHGLKFAPGGIEEFQSGPLDLLIALHACDTATDLALAAGLRAGAEIIVVAPCCHKQVRKDMTGAQLWQGVLKHGILEERQAEILTDAIRALLLESRGYKTKVFEFISLEHTSKNLMIVAERAPLSSRIRAEALRQVADIKQALGISRHRLEELLETVLDKEIPSS